MAAQLKPTTLYPCHSRGASPIYPMQLTQRIPFSFPSRYRCRELEARLPSRRNRRTWHCRAIAPPESPTDWDVECSCEGVMERLRETDKLRNCFGEPLTSEERSSLLRCLDSARLGVESCLLAGLPALREHLMDYLGAAAATSSDDLQLVEGAMLLIEQISQALDSPLGAPAAAEGEQAAGEGSSSSAAVDPSSSSSSPPPEPQPQPPLSWFRGQWQVLVTTAGGWPYGRLQYVPVLELFELSEDGQRFKLETQAGPLSTQAWGQVTWVRQPNHLTYHVSGFRLGLFGGSLSLPPAAAATPHNDLLLFAASASTALARSSAGGINLLSRPV
ncbi:hypothetical protein Agub_g7600 [Astrephomene gubernaculifera]|uniref:Uncharacterized protein n=1 Tax=Astrephomene gubernaculifera TaxID=47775 RepID=A0AAD3DSC8_9CHLO|nr:hypothetical protein Agub_g7600 [Astrephomene gubernaculifera]